MKPCEAIARLEGMIESKRGWNDYTNLPTLEYALELVKRQEARENPQPLTLEQLKERGGKPVWVVDGEGHAMWAIVSDDGEYCADNDFGQWDTEFYNMKELFTHDLHKLGWLAYDHEPKEEA